MDFPDKLQASLTDDGRYRLLLDAVTDYAIYMLDRQGVVTSWNAGARRFKGYEAHEIIGSHFSRFYSLDDRRTGLPERALNAAVNEGRFEGEGWRIRKDGTRFWAHVIIDPIRHPSGEVIGFAKVTRDLTERKLAQSALEEAREALFQSQKMDAIGQLTGGIAHDFNNLLAAVLGSLELLRKWLPEDPKAQRLLDNAMQGAERGAALTKRMLAFARRQELNAEAVDVAALVTGMTDLLERSIGSAVVIETRFPPALTQAQVDANQLELALLNLAINARDAMPNGGQLCITAAAESVMAGHTSNLAPGDYIRLSVADSGEGMDEATLARAMEPFFTTKGVGKGTGLGLSMVHGLAEQSGGRLILRSIAGVGTTAELWIPAAKPATTARLMAQPAAMPAADRKLTVLAVDDDVLVLLNTTAMLEDLGHKVFEASSGREALDILRQQPDISLVITDQAMPKMTGSQLAEVIKAERPDLKIILATGYAELPAGADGQLPKLSKPFGPKALEAMIATVLGAA